jgi:hypothetical protein
MRHVADELDATLARLGNELNHTRDAILRAASAADWATVGRVAGEAGAIQLELDKALARRLARVRAAMEAERREHQLTAIQLAQAARRERAAQRRKQP